MNIGSFLTGAIGGATQGLNTGLDIDAKLYEAKSRQRVDQATQNLQQAFQVAAKGGGIQKMDQSWFDNAAADIASTGDMQGALSMSMLGSTVRADAAKLSAQRAGLAMSAGDHQGAIADLNDALHKMGSSSVITGVTTGQDGKPVYAMSSGQTVPAEHMDELINQIQLTPKEYIAAKLEKDKAKAQIALQGSQQGLAEAQTGAVPSLIEQREASAGASRASAANSRAQASRTSTLTPLEAARTQAQTKQAEGAAGLSDTRSAIMLEQQPERMAGLQARSRKANVEADIAEQTAPAKARMLDAKANLAQAQAELGPVNTDTRSAGAMNIIDKGVKDFDARYAADGGTPTDPNAYMDPMSPTLRHVTRAVALKLQTDRKVSAGNSAQMAVQTVQNAVNGLVDANPELGQDPELAAEAAALMLSRSSWEKGADEQGQFIVLPLGDGQEPHKVYVSRAGAPSGGGGGGGAIGLGPAGANAAQGAIQ